MEKEAVDLHSILNEYRPKRRAGGSEQRPAESVKQATTSEIPDLFFDEILVSYKLSRIEIMVMMYLYRRVWCRPNLYKEYGISQLLSHTEMARNLGLNIEDIHNSLRKVEDFGFISTIRSGQYFVRKYFTKENDELFGQSYDNFEV
jgi:DNA-binding MarR family transcriptional regulator